MTEKQIELRQKVLRAAENRLKPQEAASIGVYLAHDFRGFEALRERQKALKGSVVVQVRGEWLGLRWSHAGSRYTLSLGLPDTKVNRVVAERKAKQIEQDMLTEQFDRTLAKYKSQADGEGAIAIVDLFEKFIIYKQKQVDPRTLEKYVGLMGYLRQYFRQKKAPLVTEEDGYQFRDWLLKRLSPVTVKERIGLLNACWEWALKQGRVKANPWDEVTVKVPPKQKPKPFTREEAKLILDGFKADPTYNYYLNFAEFLLATGCRIGEAIGLRWGHLSEDCAVVWIGESHSRGKRKSTKTNRDRTFELSSRIQNMLLERRPADFKSDDLVFPSPQGKPIDDHNFRNRAWKPILERVGVVYRMPRNSRHSFTSQAIDQGMAPVEVSEITGHSVKTLYQNYLGGVRGRAKLPELMD